jgi:hypothetical protein
VNKLWPCSLELINLAYQPWYSILLSQKISEQYSSAWAAWWPRGAMAHTAGLAVAVAPERWHFSPGLGASITLLVWWHMRKLKSLVPFACAEKQAETRFRLIFLEKNTVPTKKQAEKYGL